MGFLCCFIKYVLMVSPNALFVYWSANYIRATQSVWKELLRLCFIIGGTKQTVRHLCTWALNIKPHLLPVVPDWFKSRTKPRRGTNQGCFWQALVSQLFAILNWAYWYSVRHWAYRLEHTAWPCFSRLWGREELYLLDEPWALGTPAASRDKY